MNKNDVIATLASIGLILGLFGVLWLMGNYPLVVVFGCITILIWGLFKSAKGVIKDYLDERDGKGKQ
jgi:hypothetical protein